MGYKVGMGPEGKTHCGWLWWKKTCHWIDTGIVSGSHEEWFENYPLSEYPVRQQKCTTCGEVRWK